MKTPPDLADALLEAEIQHDTGDAFVRKVSREAMLDYHSRTVKFWLPAVFGAAIAALAVMATIEIVCFAPAKAKVDHRGHEAKLDPTPSLPDVTDPGGTVD
jgi:hypothetical protein